MHNFLIGLLIVISAILMTVVMMQPSKTQGLGLMTGTTDTFYTKNKGRTREAMLSRLTITFAILFALVIMALNIVK